MPYIPAKRITASVYEDKLVSEAVKENAAALEKLGAIVQYGVDATKLDEHYNNRRFATIIFQFPHTGRRDPLYGNNPNFVLICRFLKSAVHCLEPHGRILISAVDSPHYRGAFQFKETSKEAGYAEPDILSFDPSLFPGYTHVNTNDADSAIDNYRNFKTWIFKPKQ